MNDRLQLDHGINSLQLDCDEIKTFIFDCDGVLWKGSTLIPKTIETLKYLKSLNKKLLFVTNNSTSSRASYLQKFRKFGLDFIQENEIIGTAYIAALYLKKHLNPQKKVYLIGMQGLKDELSRLNIQIKQDNDYISCMDDMKIIKSDPEIGAVLIGFDIFVNYTKFAKAHTFLLQQDVLFIATNVDSTFPTENGSLPGTGSLVATLSTCTKRSPIVLGKPNTQMLDILISEFDLDPKCTCMIGDRLDTDIAFGKNGNLSTILVLTGVSKREDVDKSLVKPDIILDSIADLLNLKHENFQ